MAIRLNWAVVVGVAVGLTACSSWSPDKVLPDRSVDYQRAKEAGSDLEVPPDLSSMTIASGDYIADAGSADSMTYSEYAGRQALSGGGQRNVLPENPKIEVMRDGQQRWLVIQGEADAVWDKVIDFWRENGILLMEQDPVAGVMRTTWIENRADIKSDFITNFLRSTLDSLYSTGTRDQFRVRLERGSQPGTTDLYLSHYRMEEKLTSQTGATDVDSRVWVPKGTDPELEAIMLQKIVTFMGVEDAKASSLAKTDAGKPGTRAELITSGTPRLVMDEDFARSWRLIGLALDRVGFTVEDRDRSKGQYFVRYNDPSSEQEDQDEGWLSKLAFWSSDDKVGTGTRYIISVSGSGDSTETTVLNEKGQAETSETARRILTLIHQQIR